MKFKTKLKKKRLEWIPWLFQGDEVNGSIPSKFEGIIKHALEEHSNETLEEVCKEIEKLQRWNEVKLKKGVGMKKNKKGYWINCYELLKKFKGEEE